MALRCCTLVLLVSSSSFAWNNIPRKQHPTIISDAILGDIHRIQLDNTDHADDSAVSRCNVPTFAAIHGRAIPSSNTKYRGLEGVIPQGPAFCLDHVIHNDICQQWIRIVEDHLKFGDYTWGKNQHGAMQIIVSQETADSLGRQLSCHVNVQDVMDRMVEPTSNTENTRTRLTIAGVNRRWRIYRYAPDAQETFAPHIDAGFPPSGLNEDNSELVWDTTSDRNDIVSRLTVLLYLNDDFCGGETNFYRAVNDQHEESSSSNSSSNNNKNHLIASIRPKTGMCLVFPQGVGDAAVAYARQHWPLHEGSPVTSGSPKYVIRSDILFAEETETYDHTDPMTRYDHLVRDAFRQASPIFDTKFLHHTHTLYNPHMGVENVGPFLYSFIRMTKKTKILEIGAGYTSIWILQALHDNYEEMKRIQCLSNTGRNKLMDYPWTVPVMNEKTEPSLVCVDNCIHQKQTATGAQAMAEALQLDQYFEFRQCDAFDLRCEPESIDIVWCDFGVGSRMKDFCASVWDGITPGGFLLCHSTLTNQNTREWLEAVRRKQSAEITGIPPDEYVELSVLEPHKHYQNSITMLQKRKGYSEPVYSQYA